MKKGQVTIYIIIGIVILLVIGLIFFFRTTEEPGFGEQITLDGAKANVENAVKSCLKEQSDIALLALGYQGGYLFPPNFGTVYYEGFNVPYDYYLGYNMLPSIPDIADLHMNDFMELAMLDCLDDLNYYRDFAGIETGDLTVDTQINYDDVVIDMNYPIKITVGDSSTELEEFTTRYDVRLGHVLTVADRVINEIVESPNFLDLSFLTSQDVRVQVVPVDEQVDMYFITDGESFLMSRPYVFAFAARHTDNNEPYIYPIPAQTVKKGQRFEYQVEAIEFDDESLTYELITAIPDMTINSEGLITSTPTVSGLFGVIVVASDPLGFQSEESFLLEVEE